MYGTFLGGFSMFSMISRAGGNPDIKIWGRGPADDQLFQNMVMLHIKLKGMKCMTKYVQIFCPYTHLTPGVGSEGQNSLMMYLSC